MNLHVVIIILGFVATGLSQDAVGTQCEKGADCHLMFGAESNCRDNICYCKDGDSKARPCDLSKIKNTNMIGGTCSNSRHCVMPKSECDMKTRTCVCVEKYVESADRKSCLLIAEYIGDKCVEDIQCTHHLSTLSVCSSEKCLCANDTISAKNSCWSPADIDQKCEHSEECSHIDHTDCVNEVCKCHENYVPNKDGKECLPVAKKWNDSCSESRQCEYSLGTDSHCLNGFCRCAELYHLNSNKTACVNDTKIGLNCTNIVDCYPAGARDESNRMQCIQNKCQCRYPYISKDEYCADGGFFVKPFYFIIYIGLFMTLLFY